MQILFVLYEHVFISNYSATGSVQVKLRAWNIFSSLEVDVDMFGSCGKDSALKQVNVFFVFLINQEWCFIFNREEYPPDLLLSMGFFFSILLCAFINPLFVFLFRERNM